MKQFQRNVFLFLFLSILLSFSGSSAQDFSINADVQNNYQGLFPDMEMDGGMQQNVTLEVTGNFVLPTETRPGFLFLTAEIPAGCHIYSVTQESGGPLPTEISFPKEITVLDKPVAFPQGPQKKKDPMIYGDEFIVEYHEGKAQWWVPFRWTETGDPPQELKGSIFAQICTEEACFDPRDYYFTARPIQESEAPLVPEWNQTENGNLKVSGTDVSEDKILSPGKVSEDGHKISNSLLLNILFAYLGGLILNLMPCVLPVIGPKLFSFAKQAHESRFRILQLNLAYALGLLSVFWVLATLSKMRDLFFIAVKYLPTNVVANISVPENLGWGEHFAYPPFLITMIVLVFVMGLSFLGVWEIPIPGFVTGRKMGQVQKKEGLLGAFMMGILTTILATPCVGPFLGPVFAYTMTQPILIAYLLFTFIGLGLATPYLIVGVFPSAMSWLPKPGEWMETLKEIMGFFFLGTMVWLFYSLSQVYVVPTLALLVALWFGCWLIGKVTFSGASPQKIFIAWMTALIVSGGVGYGIFTLFATEEKIVWHDFSVEFIQKEREQGKVVFVDFTANWCPTCKTNSFLVIETEEVAEYVRKNNITCVLADKTENPPEIVEYMASVKRTTIPLIVIWKPGSDTPIILDGIITKAQLLEAFQKALE
ncbi:MAG: cytochrome c biogenesis protein CcdA [Planctomycetia bacterium]|nr:cytochrome c biogenesis protein CcdA [Planctomycetia bacterium]